MNRQKQGAQPPTNTHNQIQPGNPQPQHPMGQMLAQGNPASQRENAIPVLQAPAQSVSPQPTGAPAGAPPMAAPMGGQMPTSPMAGQQGQPDVAPNPHQAFIQTALQQGLPQEMIMQFLSSKLNLR